MNQDIYTLNCHKCQYGHGSHIAKCKYHDAHYTEEQEPERETKRETELKPNKRYVKHGHSYDPKAQTRLRIAQIMAALEKSKK